MNLARFELETAARYIRWRTSHWTEARLLRHQRHRLKRLLSHANRTSPYYEGRLPADPADLEDVPIMTKAIMMEHFDEINTAGLNRDDLITFRISQERRGTTELYPSGFSVGLSSGTSGNKVLTVLSRSERRLYSLLLWARAGIPRSIEGHRVLFALRTNNPAFTAVTRFGIDLNYVDYFVPIEDLVDLVNRKSLNVIAGPPSLLVTLAAEADRIERPVEAIISYAEELDETTRLRLGEAFGAPVAEIYQGAEGMLGFTCAAGSLHLSEDTAHIELADAGDTLGDAKNVIVTDLYRRTQPFIRYQLNDLLEVGGRDCVCGSSFRRITRIHGRTDSILTLAGTSGDQVRLMPDYVRRSINQASPDVLEYQVIQHAVNDIEVRLQLASSGDRPAIEATIVSNLEYWAAKAHGRLGGVRFSDVLPTRDETSHKLVRVVSEVQ